MCEHTNGKTYAVWNYNLFRLAPVASLYVAGVFNFTLMQIYINEDAILVSFDELKQACQNANPQTFGIEFHVEMSSQFKGMGVYHHVRGIVLSWTDEGLLALDNQHREMKVPLHLIQYGVEFDTKEEAFEWLHQTP